MTGDPKASINFCIAAFRFVSFSLKNPKIYKHFEGLVFFSQYIFARRILDGHEDGLWGIGTSMTINVERKMEVYL